MVTENQGFSIASIQPKYKDCILADAATATELYSWVTLVGGITDNIPGPSLPGHPIELFLDSYLDRKRNNHYTTPSWIEGDEKLFIGDNTDGVSGISLGSVDSVSVAAPSANATTTEVQGVPQGDPGAEQPEGSAAEGTTYVRYSDIPLTSKRLDKVLYNTLLTIVKGRYLEVIQPLQGEHARYSFAIIALWKHAGLSNSSRRLAAMESMQGLTFQGDATKWKLDFLKTIREI